MKTYDIRDFLAVLKKYKEMLPEGYEKEVTDIYEDALEDMRIKIACVLRDKEDGLGADSGLEKCRGRFPREDVIDFVSRHSLRWVLYIRGHTDALERSLTEHGLGHRLDEFGAWGNQAQRDMGYIL